MPNFFYTVIAATFGAWLGLIYFLNNFSPEDVVVILIGVFLLAVTLTLTLSVPLFFNQRINWKKGDPRKLYRTVVSKSLLISLIICIIVIVRILFKQ